MLSFVLLAAGGVSRLVRLLLGMLVAGWAAIANCLACTVGAALDTALRAIAPAFIVSRLSIKAASLVLVIAVMLFGSALSWGYLKRERTADGFIAANAASISPVLYDARHRRIGIYRPAGAEREGGDDSFGHYATIWSAEPSSQLWSCLGYLEDRRFGTWVLALGFDPIALGRAVVGLATGHGGGGSTLLNQLSRSMRGQSPSGTEAPLEKLRRKLGEWADSPALVLLLRSHGVDPERFVLANLPLLAGASGSHAGNLPYGAEAASLILFNRSASELSPEEQYLLAAANWRPVLLGPDNDPKALKIIGERWKALQHRAARCLHLLAEPGTPAYAAAKVRLFAMPTPRIHDDAFASLSDPTKGFATAVNPARRAWQSLGDGGMALVSRDLSEVEGGWRGRVANADLTFDAFANRRFAERIEISLATIERQIGSRLRLHLTGPNDAPDRAQVLVALTDTEGRIIRFFESGPGHAFDSPRPVASLGKALVAGPVLGRTDTAETLYCNRHVEGIHNAGGKDGATSCRGSDAWIPARVAYAKSLNLAFINRLGAVSPGVIREAAQAMGFTLPIDVPPRTAVPLGLFEATPRAMLQAMNAVGRVIAEVPGDVPSPHVVERLGMIAEDGSIARQTSLARAPLAWSALVKEVVPASSYLRTVLAAPLGAGGSLAALASYRAGQNSALAFHAAKTGTSTISGGATRDAMIVGTLRTADGRGFTYFILVGTANPARPLGFVNGGSLSALARLVLDEIIGGVE
jgi:membrane peptidoglycan carboxypeptidase